jgi:RNA polymerase sigma-70 factor (ECF subfamily)
VTDETDLELLVAWRDGDRERGNQLFRRHVRSISGFFRGKVAEGADDLTQKTFLALLEGADRFREDASVRTYLFGIARKQLLMHLRSLAGERRRFDPATWSIVDVGIDVARPATAHEEQALLLRALATLPVDYQVALELFYWEDLGVAEIGAVLEEPTGTVKSRLSRGRALLRRALAELAGSQALERSATSDLERWLRSLPTATRHIPQ